MGELFFIVTLIVLMAVLLGITHKLSNLLDSVFEEIDNLINLKDEIDESMKVYKTRNYRL